MCIQMKYMRYMDISEIKKIPLRIHKDLSVTERKEYTWQENYIYVQHQLEI